MKEILLSIIVTVVLASAVRAAYGDACGGASGDKVACPVPIDPKYTKCDSIGGCTVE